MGRVALMLACAAAVAVSAGGEARARPGAAAACGKLLPPPAGAYFGAFTDFNRPDAFTEDDVRASKINAFQRLAGRKVAWVYFTQHWYKGLGFPLQRVLTVWRNGQIPYIPLQPDSGAVYGPGTPQQYPEELFSLQHIIDGQFDAQLRAWADAARDTDIPILVEFGTEVNDDWGTWNAKWNGADQTGGYGDPAYPDGAERFRDAYRHLVTLFREEGATNVTWFFHADSYRQDDWWNQLKWYYPGDDYVDWLGISDYGSLTPGGPIVPFAGKLDASNVYTDLEQLSNRPIAIVEMGVVDNAAHEKARWIRRAFAALASGRYLRIHAAVWWDTRSGGTDTRIDSSPAALGAFRAAIADPFFAAQPRFTGNCLPGRPQGVTASRGLYTGKVRVTWQPLPNAGHYEIRRSGTLIGTTEASRYDDGRAKAGLTYSYSVRAVNPLGGSGWSAAAVGFRRRY